MQGALAEPEHRGRAPTGRSHDDADDETGTVDTDGAIGFDPVPLLRAFDRHDVRVVSVSWEPVPGDPLQRLPERVPYKALVWAVPAGGR